MKQTALIALVAVLLACFDTGVPIDTSPDSPLAVVEKLISAYETRRIDTFRGLFLADSFKFYVSPRLIETGIDPSVSVSTEVIDSSFTHVPEGTYTYWTYDDEVRSHRALFDQANKIRFSIQPLLDVAYHVDTLGDTVGAEVLMVDGEIELEMKPSELRILIWYVEIERQVFYTVRGTNGKWLIKKWFDFGTTQ